MKGAYVLIIKLDRNRKIKIGKKIINFNKGYYSYVGSAMNNLKKRILRHKAKKKKMHWHIDYFLKYGRIVDVVKFESTKKIECQISKRVSKIAEGSIIGFGCSDCNCQSHLYYFGKKPKIN